MKTFHVRRQTFLTKAIGKTATCQWAEVSTEDIRIVIDGTQTDNTLIIQVDVNGIRYVLTDVLLEVMLGHVAEQYSSEYLNFRVYDLIDVQDS